MSKENKGTYITVTLIVLLIVLFTLAIGVVIGVFAVSEPDASNLQFWSSLGDALNPLIGFISAVLVAAGLLYTARDFKLARKEFEANRNELATANRFTKDRMRAEEAHKEKVKNLDRVRVLLDKVDKYKFTDGLNLTLILYNFGDEHPIPMMLDDSCIVNSIEDLYDFLEHDQLEMRVAEQWMVCESEMIKLYDLMMIIENLYSAIEYYVENFDHTFEIKYQVNIKILEKIEHLLNVNILMYLEDEDEVARISPVYEQFDIKNLSCISSLI